MKTRYLVAASPEYAALADLGDPDRKAWAAKWGVEYVRALHTVSASGGISCWERPRLWLDHLRKCDWLGFGGSDTLITNLTISPAVFTSLNVDLVVASDTWGLQSDSFFMRNCKSTQEMLEWVIRNGERYSGQEQHAMLFYLSGKTPFRVVHSRIGDGRVGGFPLTGKQVQSASKLLNLSKVRVKLATQRELNAFPYEQYPHIVGYDEYGWHPGDFLLHMPCHSLENRRKAFHGYLKQVVRDGIPSRDSESVVTHYEI